jgi:hypothetical protein
MHGVAFGSCGGCATSLDLRGGFGASAGLAVRFGGFAVYER